MQRTFRVTGRVQGVGFRMWTCRRALELGLRGTVRNHPDGSVLVHVAGPAHLVDQLRSLLAQGPPAAAVERVEEIPNPAEPLPPDFRIVT
ncbi:MAG TPA: acylphosphatase [Longimicrobiales bacterium]